MYVYPRSYSFVATVRSRHPVVNIEPLMACRLRQACREVINVLTQRAASQACSKQLANVRIVEIL